jgi:hypothetical protein
MAWTDFPRVPYRRAARAAASICSTTSGTTTSPATCLRREAWRAAERGVRVRLLLDDMNAARTWTPKLLTLDGHPNIELRLYNPFRNRKGIGATVRIGAAHRQRQPPHAQQGLDRRRQGSRWWAGATSAMEYFGASDEVNFRDLRPRCCSAPPSSEASAVFDRLLEQRRGGAVGRTGRTRRTAASNGIARSIESRSGRPDAQRYLAATWRQSPNVSGPTRASELDSVLDRGYPRRLRPAAEMAAKIGRTIGWSHRIVTDIARR